MSDARFAKSGQALRVALLNLLARKTLDQITIRDIAAEADVHYATFFRHHPSKESLLDAVAADQIDRLVEFSVAVMQKTKDRKQYLAAHHATCEYVNEHRQLWTALLTGGAAAAMREELLRLSLQIARDHGAKDSGWLPLELGVTCSVSLTVDTLTWWLRQEAGAVSPEKVAQILSRLMPLGMGDV
jgi:AcrR family transcriptional regulator